MHYIWVLYLTYLNISWSIFSESKRDSISIKKKYFHRNSFSITFVIISLTNILLVQLLKRSCSAYDLLQQSNSKDHLSLNTHEI